MNNDRTQTEAALIGAMLLSGHAIDAAVRVGIKPAAITDPENKALYRAILASHEQARPIDALTVSSDAQVPLTVAYTCMDIATTPAHAEHYAGRLAGYATLDRYATLGTWIAGKVAACQSPDDASEIAAEVCAAVDQAAQAGRVMVTGTLGKAAKSWLDRVTAPEEDAVMLDWPVDAITRAMGRVDRELIWLIAQPSLGKTAFVLQWLLTLGKRGYTVSLASLESSSESIGSRAIAQMVPMDNYPLRQRTASAAEIATAYQICKDIPASVRVTDGSMSLEQVYAWGKAEARRGSRLLVIDNTRHIKVTGADSRINATAAISSRMKDLRDETRLPVVVLHHSTIDKETGNETASWSSDIKKDTDVELFLRRGKTQGKVELFVEKNREGRRGYGIDLRFQEEYQLFREWTEMDDMEAQEEQVEGNKGKAWYRQ